MTIAQVLYVLEIADCRSISAAAERQFISQSALSQQIQRLEGELGYPLFVRTPRGLTLTAAGETFCREARPVAEQWQRLCSAVKPDGRRGRRLRIGMGARVYSNRLFQDIARYFDSHPEIDVTFVTEAGLDVLAGLRDGSIDLALDRLPAGEEGDPSLFVCDLVRERQCVLMSPDDPRAALPWLSFGDLQGCNMISGLENSAEDRMLRRTCQKYGISLSRVYRSDGIDTNMRLVRDGMGVVLGPESFASYYGVSAVPLHPETFVSLKFICLQSGMKKKDVQRFRSYLCGVCRRRGTACERCTSPCT